MKSYGQFPYQGRFIVLEGGEGAGKTTHTAFLAELLTQKGLSVVTTREPGGTPLAENIRNLIVGDSGKDLDRLTEVSLFMSARHDHVMKKILPALQAGQWVICDRYRDSTYAYQVCGWGLDEAVVAQFEAIFGFPHPDYTLVFDLPPESGLNRASLRSADAQNRYDRLGTDFHNRVRKGFLTRFEQGRADNGYSLFDATQPLDHVQQHLKQWVEGLF